MERVNCFAPVSENLQSLLQIPPHRVLQTCSMELAFPTTGARFSLRPSGNGPDARVPGPLIVSLYNLGPNICYYRFLTQDQNDALAVASVADVNIVVFRTNLNLMLPREYYIHGYALTATSTVRVEVSNLDF